MNKQRLELEYVLRSNSENIIWNTISTASGLQKWIADEVTENGDKLTFTWGDIYKHHETRTATILKSVKNKNRGFRPVLLSLLLFQHSRLNSADCYCRYGCNLNIRY
jgi:hypothetical protein